MVTTMSSQWPASASSIELSTTSNTRWCRPVPSEVSPMYMPGRLRTASRPSRIWMRAFAVGVVAAAWSRSGSRCRSRACRPARCAALRLGLAHQDLSVIGASQASRLGDRRPLRPNSRAVCAHACCRATRSDPHRHHDVLEVRVARGSSSGAELLESASSSFTMSWLMLASASIR